MTTLPREGSSWRRWDLHIHAPTATLNNQFEGQTDDERWEKYLSTVEASGSYGALGITDYLSVDGYRRAASYKASGRLQNVGALFPNVELRILPVTGQNKGINLHLILSEDVVPRLDELLWTNLEFGFSGNTYKCTHGDLVRLGRAYSGKPDLADGAAHQTGVEQFKVEFGQIAECLKKNKELRLNAIVAIANGSGDGNSGIQESGLAALRTEIYRLADVIFSGNPKDRTFFLGHSASDSPEDIRAKFGALKPCVHGCDAHDLSKIGNPDLNRHTWIKADTTFEGLRQILFEPEARVWIGEAPPPTPVHRARSVSITIPPGAEIIWDGQPHPFCFAGQTHIALAAGLTCVIGGRGSGKSTLLNLMQERVAPGRNTFWKERQLRQNRSSLSVAECVAVDLTGDHAQIEFIAQNQVEQFALEPSRLTEAILARLFAMDADGALRRAADAVEAAVDEAGKRDLLLRAKEDVTARIAELKQQAAAYDTLIKSFADPQYMQATAALQEATNAQQRLQVSRERLQRAIVDIELATRKHRADEAPANEYDQRLNSLMAEVESAVASARANRDLSQPGDDERELGEAAAMHRKTVEAFLQSRGLSPENQRDVSDASSKLGQTQALLRRAELELTQIQQSLEQLVVTPEAKMAFEEIIRARVEEVNRRFSGGHAEARRLELRYSFGVPGAEDKALEWLTAEMAKHFDTTRVRADHLRSVLEKAGPLLASERAILLDSIQRDEGSKTAQVLDAFFAKSGNLDLWDNERTRLLIDALQFLNLEVLYDGKPLTVASFGQRCSAVLVVLISLGNTPIIIDEPEAHLDSAIIADFMVEMVKRVKQHRQIVFATHNANFVVNGDAELIHALAMTESKRSEIQSATLEDVQLRPLILALEGGERAFRQREGRYSLET